MPSEDRKMKPIPRNASYLPALGIMYVSAYLKKMGFDVDCMNMNHHDWDSLRYALSRVKYDVICTGGMYAYLRAYEKIFSMAKESNKNIRTILGGAAATAHPEFILKEIKADYLILGEGEKTTASLLSAMASGNLDIEEIPGIAFVDNKRDSVVKTTSSPPIADLDKLPLPDRDGFEFTYFLDNHPRYSTMDMRYKRERTRAAAIIGGRDCPFRCTFCFRVMGGKPRFRSTDNIIFEIEQLKSNYGVNYIEILDDLFTVNKSRVYEFCSRIKPLGMHWWCQCHARTVNEDMLKSMKDAGCEWVGYGFESANEQVLKSMKKGIKVKDIEHALHITRKAQLTLQANFIFGDPVETFDTARETLRFWSRHKSYHINLSAISPYPGTTLYWNLIKKGAIDNLRLFWDNPGSVNLSSMTEAEYRIISILIRLEDMTPSFFKITHFEKTLDGKYRLSLICPVCKEKSREEFLIRPNIVACPNCYQRARIDLYDLMYTNRISRYSKKLMRKIAIGLIKQILYNKKMGLLINDIYLLSKKYVNYSDILKQFGIAQRKNKEDSCNSS